VISRNEAVHVKILTAVGIPMTSVAAEKYIRAESVIPVVNMW